MSSTENQILTHFRPIFGSFLDDFRLRAEVKKVTSQAELWLWLKPARLKPITSTFKYLIMIMKINI